MITVLTPTYNRAHTLERAFKSLCAQTDARFEWLVVDDGSTDGTSDLLAELRRQVPFEMRTACQRNGGKHTAINHGCRLAQGEWVLILDSDDALVRDAIATVSKAIDESGEKSPLGLCFRKTYFDGRLVGVPSDESRLYLHPTQASELFRGDLAYVFRRSALRSFPFPVIPDENFFPELYVWNQIGDQGRILFFPSKAIYLCDYLADGYSANFKRNLARNPRGFLIYYRAQLRRETNMVRRLKCFVRAMQCLGYIYARKARS